MEPYFRLDDVWVTTGDRPSLEILSALTLDIADGDRCALVGHSGAGKSTVLRLLNRLLDPSRGRVLRSGEPLSAIHPSRLRREVALVPQEPIWLPGTARDNLFAPSVLGIVDRSEAETRLEEILDLAGIDPGHLDRGEDQLSVGQRQRVVLGRALMTRPRALLLDEPTSALDPPGARALLRQILRLGESEALTMVMVTHRLRDALEFARTAVLLEGGRIVDQGPAGDIVPRLEIQWEES